MAKICAYCEINSAGNSDHVFPKSLGGQDLYMDCVCNQCNNDFSKTERELFQKSLIALMRSYEGVEGYTKRKKRPSPLKYPEIFQFDPDNGIVYEVGLTFGFNPFMRPQFMQIRGKFYSESPSKDELIAFVDLFNEWRKNNLVMVTAFPAKKGDKYKAAKYFKQNDKYSFEEVLIDKVKKEVIHYNLMGNNEDIKDSFEPRLFVDDSDNLISRSRSVEEGVKFMADLLDYCNEPASFGNYSDKNLNEPIKVRMKFDMLKMQQALVKIGLNCLMYYYPQTQYDVLLRPAKDNALNGARIKTALDKKIEQLDTRPYMHTVLFYQLDKGLMVRTSLFSGQFPYSFLIEDLRLFARVGEFSGVEVDYKEKKQRHFNQDEFLISRANDLGYLKELQESI